MSTTRIEALADQDELVPVVAEWHWNEWGHVDPSGSLQSWTEALAGRTNLDRIPASYVAIVEGEPVGSVVLVEHDMPDRRDLADLSPWMAGLFVQPDHRQKGIGSMLVRHAESEAARFGADYLYAYTSKAEALYKRLGWQTLTSTEYEDADVTILSRDLSKTRYTASD